MDIVVLLSTDVLAIMALCFTVFLAKRNTVINNTKTYVYIAAAATTIILVLLEIITIIMEHSSSINLVIPQRIANIIGFSLCPVVPFVLLFFNIDIVKRNFYHRFLLLPIFFNFIMCALSYKTGWIFYIDAEKQYTRGNLFLLPTLISLFYLLLMIIAIVKNNEEYEKNDKNLLLSIFAIPSMGIIVQILVKDVLLIWGSVAISLLLYYIFLRELQFNNDVQTGIKNRFAFKKEMERYLKGDINAVFVVLDINNLKSTNDKYGHKVGDEIIYIAAKIIRESFIGIGKVFRIGGDEFCVICTENSRELIDSALSELDKLLNIVNQERVTKIEIAYGYSIHNKDEYESIYAALEQADKAMYKHKAKLKGVYGRRADD